MYLKSVRPSSSVLSSLRDWMIRHCQPRTSVRGYHVSSLRDFRKCTSNHGLASAAITCRRFATGIIALANRGLASAAFSCRRFATEVSALPTANQRLRLSSVVASRLEKLHFQPRIGVGDLQLSSLRDWDNCTGRPRTSVRGFHVSSLRD